MLDLRSLSLDDIYRCSADLRDLGEAATDSDDAAKRITSYLFEQLRFPESNAPECPLVRLFRGQPFSTLDRTEAERIVQAVGPEVGPSTMCLTLRASRGIEPQWNDPASSEAHRVLPLASEEALARMPMLAALVSQLGIGPARRADGPRAPADRVHPFDVFHVEHARGSPYLPEQARFIEPYRIESVVGIGGILPPSEPFVVLLFSCVPISKPTAELFRMLVPSVGLALLARLDELRSLEMRLRTYELIVQYHQEMAVRKHRELEHAAAELSRLLAERQRFEALVENSSDFIGIASPEGRPMYLNPAARRMLGLDADDDLSDLDPHEYCAPDRCGEKKMSEVFATVLRKGCWVGESILRNPKTNASIPVSDEHFAIRAPETGELLGIGCISRDISEKRRAEQEREQLLAAAQQAEALAQAASHAKDQFLATLGHELRNPLSPILTALELMTLRGEQSREQAVIERQARHLSRLVDDLLDLARIGRGKLEVKKAPIELSAVVDRAIEMASPKLEKLNQRLVVNVPREGLLVEGDLGRLAQVVSNILDNASKYSDPGREVAISAERVGSVVRLRVRDQGAGIPREELDSIFYAFTQHSAEGRTPVGLGLGLAIVRSLVELHGGRVYAHSEGVGKGSELVVELPSLADEASEGRPVDDAASGPRLVADTTRRVLVVDDNADAADTLADVLAELGYDVCVAHDGPSALALAPGFRPEVALLDIGLPEMDGYELARRLRHLPGMCDELRLIAITGYGQEGDRQRAMEAGFAAHLVKPVALEGLVRAVSA